MQRIAIEQARKRIQKARAAVAVLAQACTFSDADSAWSDFLLASGGVYSKLEQGAKGSGQSEAWFGRKKHDRKHDPLLNYIHHARNAEEHSIKSTTSHHSGSFAVKGSGHYRFDGVIGTETNLKITHLCGEPPNIEITHPHVKLITVRDIRYDDRFNPPTSHLGEDLRDQSPLGVATLALSYFEALVAEADKFAT